jgi:hypothetical protein
MGTVGFKAACVLVTTMAAYGCGPLRLDATPEVRGRITNVHEQRLSIKHKAGPTYDVALTPKTRILHDGSAIGVRDVCPGQRAIATLSAGNRAQAVEVRIYGGRCD